MKRRVECRFSVKYLIKIICLGSVIVSANNTTQSDQVKTNSYTAVMVSTTTMPTTLTLSSGDKLNEERTIQSMMMAMLDGKEKSWSHKKKGVMGTHNLDIKMPAQESFFCKFIKRQSVIMFSFCDDENKGWGWKKKGKKKKKKSKKKKGKKKGMGWGQKKKGGGKKKKKGGGKKKKSKKKGSGGGWGKKPKPTKGWEPPPTKGWEPPPTKGWEPPPTKGWEPPPTKGWEEEESEEGWGGEEEEDEWQGDTKKGQNDDDLGPTSQDDDYKPKKDYKGKVGETSQSKPIKTKSASASTSYLSEFDLNKWENSDDVKNNPEDLIHHHFFRRGGPW